jgi:hypothetical protein
MHRFASLQIMALYSIALIYCFVIHVLIVVSRCINFNNMSVNNFLCILFFINNFTYTLFFIYVYVYVEHIYLYREIIYMYTKYCFYKIESKKNY